MRLPIRRKKREETRRPAWTAPVAAVLIALPKVTLTVLSGRLLRSRLSRAFIPLYAAFYRIDLPSCDRPWRRYGSIAEFFSRPLPAGSRSCSASEEWIVSPVDGRVAEMGVVRSGRAIQVKGVEYEVAALLASDAAMFEGGSYLTVYLSPGDYHRIHAPADATVQRMTHVPGTLFPVNRAGVHTIRGLYTKNERLITWFERGGQAFALAQVGSLIVGSVKSQWIPHVARRRRRAVSDFLDEPFRVSRGDEIARFEFGSTVVLVVPPDAVLWAVARGDRLRAQDPIGRWL